MTDTKRAIAALEDGIKNCPRVSVAAGAGPAFDCSCDKGLVTCASIIGKVAQALAAERERIVRLCEDARLAVGLIDRPLAEREAAIAMAEHIIEKIRKGE
jgi:hypothetical protein